jgi:hypothetical protein
MDSQVDLWMEVLRRHMKFGRLHWICSREVSGTRGRRSWSKYRFGSMLLEKKKLIRCHRLLMDRLFNEIEKEKDFIHKKGITKKKLIIPKVDLLAWYIDTTTSRCLRTYAA